MHQLNTGLGVFGQMLTVHSEVFTDFLCGYSKELPPSVLSFESPTTFVWVSF